MFIGFSGRARHGKTICCDTIQKYAAGQNQSVRVYDIGDMIRREAIELGRLPADLQRVNMTRADLQVLIDLGKERRSISMNYWVEKVLATYSTDNVQVGLCPNIRLPLEAQAIRDAGGFVVRCTRLNENGSLYISEDRPPNDITETALEFWPADFYLTTKPDQIEFLERQAVALYDYLLQPEHGPIERFYEQRRTV